MAEGSLVFQFLFLNFRLQFCYLAMLKSRKTDLADCDSMVERSESFNAARIVGAGNASSVGMEQ